MPNLLQCIICNFSKSSKSQLNESLVVGDLVTAWYGNSEGEPWFHGTIVGVNDDGTFDVKYNDGEVEYAKPQDRVMKGLLTLDDVQARVEARTSSSPVNTEGNTVNHLYYYGLLAATIVLQSIDTNVQEAVPVKRSSRSGSFGRLV